MHRRSHPAELKDYPEWMGHSIGHWEGDTLVVETVGLEPRTWIDSDGKEHSDKLKLTERFKKANDNVLNWTVTIDDPVFYKEPWSVSIPMKRQNTRIMSYSCLENERDTTHMLPTIGKEGGR